MYDTVVLSDGNSYSVMGETDYNGEKYYLLSKVIGDDELSLDDFRFVLCNMRDGKTLFKDVKDENLLLELGKIFAKQMENLS